MKREILTMLFLNLIIMAAYLYCHELVHVQINTYWGCDSDIKFEKEGILTYPLCTQHPPDMMYLAHSINEVVGYLLIFPTVMLINIFAVMLIEGARKSS